MNERPSNNDSSEYQQAYSDEGFWQKLRHYASTAGKEVVEKALLMYYAAQQEDAPAWARATIFAALGYFITPLDAIADLTPAVGYADDLGVLALALAAVARYINDDARTRATTRMRAWFGSEDH